MDARVSRHRSRRRRGGAATAAVRAIAACALFAALAGTVSQCAGPGRGTGAGDLPFLSAALSARPASELCDLYKLCYQGHFGVGHLIRSRAGARDYLLEEMAEMGEGPTDPLLEPCSADGRMLRVNLRAFARAALDTEALLDAVMASANSFVPDTAAFLAAWSAVGDAVRGGALPYEAGAYDSLAARLRDAGYPALHHSDAYRRAYRPAYRVVLREAFARAFPAVVVDR